VAVFVIVPDPRTQCHLGMALVQGDHEIQAFPAHRADQSFTSAARTVGTELSAPISARKY
jgi:hypothetical protein